MRPFRLAALALLCSGLAACNLLGTESPEVLAAHRAAEGKAVGSGCRHAGRAIEDCFSLNRKAEKAAVFAGWKEMNDYMRENKIAEVAPQLNGAEAKPPTAKSEDDEPEERPRKKVAKH